MSFQHTKNASAHVEALSTYADEVEIWYLNLMLMISTSSPHRIHAANILPIYKMQRSYSDLSENQSQQNVK